MSTAGSRLITGKMPQPDAETAARNGLSALAHQRITDAAAANARRKRGVDRAQLQASNNGIAGQRMDWLGRGNFKVQADG